MYPLTIELDSVTELRLKERSHKEGKNEEELAARLLADSLAAPESPEITEAHLIEHINQGWNEQEWQHYHSLVALRKEERLTEGEYQELCELTNSRELAHANRLRLVIELARLRGISFDDAMTQLGIGARVVE